MYGHGTASLVVGKLSCAETGRIPSPPPRSRSTGRCVVPATPPATWPGRTTAARSPNSSIRARACTHCAATCSTPTKAPYAAGTCRPRPDRAGLLCDRVLADPAFVPLPAPGASAGSAAERRQLVAGHMRAAVLAAERVVLAAAATSTPAQDLARVAPGQVEFVSRWSRPGRAIRSRPSSGRCCTTWSLPVGRWRRSSPRPGSRTAARSHLTPHVRLFRVAHHDGLQPTQQTVVWNLSPQSGSEGPTFISRTAPHQEASPT